MNQKWRFGRKLWFSVPLYPLSVFAKYCMKCELLLLVPFLRHIWGTIHMFKIKHILKFVIGLMLILVKDFACRGIRAWGLENENRYNIETITFHTTLYIIAVCGSLIPRETWKQNWANRYNGHTCRYGTGLQASHTKPINFPLQN